MKKSMLLFSIVIIGITIFVFVNKTYYPKLPIATISAKEALDRMKESNKDVVEIGKDELATWYITRSREGGMDTVDENITETMTANEWIFKEKLGAGLIFEKDGEELIITTQMWTKKFVLIRVPFE